MGNRKRIGTHAGRAEAASKIKSARKEFTRSKALHAMAHGADFNDKKFTTHRNYHVRERAWRLAGAMIPETMAERKALCDSLTRGRSLAGTEMMKDRFGLNDDNVLLEEAVA